LEKHAIVESVIPPCIR